MNTPVFMESLGLYSRSIVTNPLLKITKDAFHLLLSFELTREERKGQMAFVPISWQLYTLENLRVQVKHEFNASNKDFYKPEFLLAGGKIK